MTPQVIYDENEIKDASEDLKNRLRGLRKIMKD